MSYQTCHPRLVIVMILLSYQNGLALIIPDEVPTLLSLIYSNIPTIKKGTDSRIGWGFRLGDRADFQVLLELGPQKDTLPLSNQGGSSSKRNTADGLANQLYAQGLLNRNKGKEDKEMSETSGGKFIQEWSNNLPNQGHPEDKDTLMLGVGEVDAREIISPDASAIDNMLEVLYREKSQRDKMAAIPAKPKMSAISKDDALDNVNVD